MSRNESAMTGHFRVVPRALKLFGRELVSNSVVALAELVKNSYDADASKVRIRFDDVTRLGGQIVIEDDGHGMTVDDLTGKWLVIGTEEKERRPTSPRFQRRRVGEKGIGRFAVERLGRRLVLISKTSDMTQAARLEINWDELESMSEYLDEIPINIEFSPWRQSSGTRIEITDLRDEWSKSDIDRLQRELYLLVSPFRQDSTFRVNFNAPEFPQYSGRLSPVALEDADFVLTSSLSPDGVRRHTVKTFQSKVVSLLDESEGPTGSPLRCGPVEATYYIFRLGGEDWKLRPRVLGLAQVRRLLKEYGGVRLYRDAFRVKPYGDPGTDWLDLNLRRAQSPEFWPSTNTLIGDVRIQQDSNVELIDQTNREGIIRNRAYEDLVTFLLEGFDLYVRWRLHQRGPKRRAATNLDIHNKKIAGHLGRMRRITESLNDDTQLQVMDQARKIADLSRATQKELVSELQMLRNLASLGIGVAVFGHETESDIRIVKEVSDIVQNSANLAYDELSELGRQLASAADRLESYSALVTDYLREPKRTMRTIGLNEIVASVLGKFQYLLNEHGIQLDLDLATDLPLFDARPIDVEAILINLITNSIHFFGESSSTTRTISLMTRRLEDRSVSLVFADSGPGIAQELGDQVFLPFVTTKVDGTGLGLTIVKDTVEGYGGHITRVAHPLGGAAFAIVLPTEGS